MTRRNRELFDRIADHIETKPHKYSQNLWFDVEESVRRDQDATTNECGTSGCIAGWACFFTVGVLTNENGDAYPKAYLDDREVLRFAPPRRFESTYVRWSEVGAKVLGLTEQEADILFEEDWNRDPDGHGPMAILSEPETVAKALRLIGRGAEIMDTAVETIEQAREKMQADLLEQA